MTEFEEEQFEEVPKFDEARFDQIINLNEAQRHWFLEGPEMFVIHRPSGKVPKTFSNLRRLPCRLVKEIFPNRTTVQRRDRKFVLVLEFETDILSLELALQYLLACVNEGKYADVETDEMWCGRILETYKVFGAEYGVTRMVQSAAAALRRLEAEERAERAEKADRVTEGLEIQRCRAKVEEYRRY